MAKEKDFTWSILILFLIVIFIVLFCKRKEKYYLRDLPFDTGFGGWPPEIYSEDYGEIPTGMYGAPIQYGETGYDPGMGLVW